MKETKLITTENAPKLMWMILIVFLIGISISSALMDDSDKSFFQRSGVEVVTDYKTRLQYLKVPMGGIIPRLDPEGGQMRRSEFR